MAPPLCLWKRQSVCKYMEIGPLTIAKEIGVMGRGKFTSAFRGEAESRVSLPSPPVMCLMWSLRIELLKRTSVPKNVKIKAVLF